MVLTQSAPTASDNRRYLAIDPACTNRPWRHRASPTFLLAAALICATAAKAQNPELPDQGLMQQTSETPGKTSGNYNTQQNIEFGYRDSTIHGNLSNYDTFLNYGSGWRLFDYDLDMNSV